MKCETSREVLKAAVEALALGRGKFAVCVVWDDSGELDLASIGPARIPAHLLALVLATAAGEVDGNAPVLKDRIRSDEA